jgi:flagellar hook protein FlgE
MLTSLNSAVSGLQECQVGLNVIGNNIANANTTGFKSSRADFEDAFSQTLMGSTGSTSTSSGTNAMQYGTGVATGAITNLYTQGSLTRTGISSDLGINGDGFFIVKDPANGADFATRAGDFTLDSNGYLVTNGGYRVQGYSDTGLSTRGDIKIDTTGGSSDPKVSVAGFSVAKDGKITVKLSDGSSFVRGQVQLQRFTNQNALMKEGSNLYSGLTEAGPMDGSSGLGEIYGGALELSNVDLTIEFTNLITTQRAFQANARMITTSDEVLQELVSLKR